MSHAKRKVFTKVLVGTEVQPNLPLRTRTESSPLPVMPAPVVEDKTGLNSVGRIPAQEIELALKVFLSEAW